MFAKTFDCQPTLFGRTLRLEPLAENDVEGMYQAASDPDVWAGHPATDRYKREVFETYFSSRALGCKPTVTAKLCMT